MKVTRVAGTDPVALGLVGAMVAEVGRMYEPGLPAGSSARPEELSPPGGGFVVLWEGKRPLAGGGVKRFDDRICEIKRMYVAPDARGRGLGPELLAALEELARELGYAVARLDTGGEMPGVRRMYERAGYASVPDYNGNPYAGWWGEKALGGGSDDRTSPSARYRAGSRTFASVAGEDDGGEAATGTPQAREHAGGEAATGEP